MSASYRPYFHPASLRDAYRQDVDEALLAGEIVQEERDWLAQLEQPEPVSLRVDKVELGDGTLINGEMAASLILSNPQEADAPLYVWCPGNDLQRFSTRSAMAEAITSRFSVAPESGSVCELVKIDTAVFEHIAHRVCAQQSQRLSAFARQFVEFPSLAEAIFRVLTDRLGAGLPGVSHEPDKIWVQTAKVPAVDTQPASHPQIQNMQTLLSLALERFGVSTPDPGSVHIYFDAQGQQVEQAQTAFYDAALAISSEELTTAFTQIISQWWHSPEDSNPRMSQQAASLMAEGFRQDLINLKSQSDISREDFAQLMTLWRSCQGQTIPSLTSLSVSQNNQDPFKLSGAFLVETVAAGTERIWFYSAQLGLRQYENRALLKEHLNTAVGQQEVLEHLSLEDRQLFDRQATVELFEEPITGAVFEDRMSSLIALQKRNVRWLQAQPSARFSYAAVTLDDALDINHGIDRRLLSLGGLGRWKDAAQTNSESYVREPKPRTFNVLRQSMVSEHHWIERINDMDGQVRVLASARPDVDRIAAAILDRSLCALGENDLRAYRLKLRFAAKTPDVIQPDEGLIDRFLEHASGKRVGKLGVDTTVLLVAELAPPRVVTSLFPGLLDSVFDNAQELLERECFDVQSAFYTRPLRYDRRRVDAHSASRKLRADHLRMTVEVQRRMRRGTIRRTGFLQQVLERPVPTQRQTLGDGKIRASAILVDLRDGKPLIELTNTLALQHGTGSTAPMLVWTAHNLLWDVQSVAELENRLDSRFVNQFSRDLWLALVEPIHAGRFAAYLMARERKPLRVELRTIEQDVIEYVQAAEERRQRSVLYSALRLISYFRVDAELVRLIFQEALRDNVNFKLCDGLFIQVQQLLFETFMPAWLEHATKDQLLVYVDILLRYAGIDDPDQTFLFGIPALSEFARLAVNEKLKADFPQDDFNADEIDVTHTRYVSGWAVPGELPSAIAAVTQTQTETLTQFACSHLSMAGESVSITSKENPLAVGKLDSAYIHRLIRQVNVGGRYQQVLATEFQPTAQQYAKRRSLFIEHLPARMLDAAFDRMMGGAITDVAYKFINAIADMPDDLARQPVEGKKIVIRPFELIAAPGYEADRVPGVYLIGPENQLEGPQVMYAIYHEDFSFRQFDNFTEIIEQLKTETRLQTLVLNRVSPLVRSRYDHGGFIEPHLRFSTESAFDVPLFSPKPPVLSDRKVAGNALEFLFVDTLDVLRDIAGKQAVTTAQADWQSFLFLMTEVGQQVLTFMPGKLGMLISAWQSHTLFSATADSLSRHRWGRAVSEFTAAVSMLISSRHADGESALSGEAVEPTQAYGDGEPLETSNPSVFSWRNDMLPAGLKKRLDEFQVKELALIDLDYDQVEHVYRLSGPDGRDRQFIAVVGQVFEVRQEHDEWHIVSGERKGPRVRLNREAKWELNLSWGLRGGAQIFHRIKGASIEADVDAVYATTATGMKNIRLMYHKYARQIEGAHHQALTYLINCLGNLRAFHTRKGLAPEVDAAIRETFGISVVSQPVINDLQRVSESMFAAFLDPSLSPNTSPRFVIGYSKPGNTQTQAFTVANDPERRLFLTELFFSVPDFYLDLAKTQSANFNMQAHYRAAALLHEVSHIVLDTRDIAYLEAAEPFVDLIRTDIPEAVNKKSDLETVRGTYLSHRTPKNQLFKRFEGLRWVNIDDTDEAYSAVLELTGTSTLDDARDVFLSSEERRRKVILANADSLALLIMTLGRTLRGSFDESALYPRQTPYPALGSQSE